MFKPLVRGTLYLAFAGVVGIAPAFAADSSSEGKDPVVAKINGKPLLRSEVMAEAANLPPQVRQMSLDKLFPHLLDQAIAERVVSQAGYAKHLENSEEVKKAMKELERKVVADAYLHQAIEAQMTDKVLKAKYEELKANTKPQDEVKASHILVKSEDEAKDIIKQLKDGADFAKLAKDKSIDKASAEHGGDLGYFTANEMVKPFSDAAFAMKSGQVSDTPVKSDFGWHVIKVEDRRPATPPTFDQVKDQLKAGVAQDLASKEIKRLVSDAKVERFQEDGSPAKQGELEAPVAKKAASNSAPAAKSAQ